MFGQALADALMLPLNAFNKLRSGIDWVLEKLGVINKESDTLDQTAARTQAATYGSGGYIRRPALMQVIRLISRSRHLLAALM